MNFKLCFHQIMKIDVIHIAKLANLPLESEEKEKLEKQLEETLSYVDRLNAIDTEGVEPKAQVTGLENRTREDEVTPSLSQEDVLKNAKSVHNGFFKVPAIFEAES